MKIQITAIAFIYAVFSEFIASISAMTSVTRVKFRCKKNEDRD